MSAHYARTKTRLALTVLRVILAVLPVGPSLPRQHDKELECPDHLQAVGTLLCNGIAAASNLIGYFVFAYCFNCSF